MEKKFCLYYQAHVDKKSTLFVGGIFRNEDHLAFMRALEENSEIQEFFVPEDLEERFLYLIDCLISMGYVRSLQKLPNRLA
jgi:hypothetical protein